jgi:predicted PurR-regulated permease PerM
MNYIPNIGSIIAGVPAVLFALVQLGLGGAIWTLASFMVVNNVLGNIIEPRIMGKGLGLSTLVVFLSLLFWGFIFGTVGMFLSVPFTMTIKIILEQNEKTKWIAILLGTPAEAEAYLAQDKQIESEPRDK